jgi:hypothetical protein
MGDAEQKRKIKAKGRGGGEDRGDNGMAMLSMIAPPWIRRQQSYQQGGVGRFVLETLLAASEMLTFSNLANPIESIIPLFLLHKITVFLDV